MNNLWKAVIVLCASIAVAHCLTCRQCPVGIFGTCILASDVTCNNATESCYTGEARFNATGAIRLHTRGCQDSDRCGRTMTGDLLGVGYTTRYHCCNTNLCNGATSVQLPLTVALFTAILSCLGGFWGL